ncbi:DUF484 family protein [Marinicella rhabdoformis]|uniref:DUF484 family protein n=1 Tax=Marinicella rhabdoformis TaxID=2580566 RepID=UPI0012AECA4A|nr:DUF484 family protein [Marinicella rhabdoformis]
MSDSTKQVTEHEVINYLKEHPEFFINNPGLLQQLTIGNPQGDVVSLADRKMLQLQTKNQQLAKQMKQLIANAQRSEGLMDRLFQLLTDLSMNAPKGEFVSALVGFIQKDFASDYFKLYLGDIKLSDDEVCVHYHSAQLKTLFASFNNNDAPLAGRLPAVKLKALFGDESAAQSAIVLPIGAKAAHGLLAFGSKDDQKFHPDHASDVLQKLAQILAVFFDSQAVNDGQQSQS